MNGRGVRQAGVLPRVQVEMDSVESLLGVCRYGDLASIVPERAARQAPDLPALAAAAKSFGYPFLLKARRNGYDGKGNVTVRA